MKLSNLTGKIASAELQNFKQMATVKNPFKQFAIAATLILFFFLSPQVYASHIVGGDISYRHLSGDDYEINLRIYRDSVGYGFDPEVHFFIYKENTLGEYIDLDLHTIVYPENINGISMDPLADPCVSNPPYIAFEYKIYTEIVINNI